ncbi:MAG: N-acetylornithine carbamoyltransferase [Pseudomonadota bacterium]
MKHFLSTEDWSQSELQNLLSMAADLKREPINNALAGKSIALLFFNNSMRTRTSFELGAHQLGAKAIVLTPGKDAWPLAFDLGEVMDGVAEEHVAEAAQVLSRYCDFIAVRCFPKFENWQLDRQDRVIQSFAEYATVPVINMETIVHPCQELALAMTMQEHFGTLANRKFVLTWTYHPKPLNSAVANSALLIATKLGMDVTLLCPNEEYLLDAHYMEAAKDFSAAAGQTLTVTHDIAAAYDGADMVYAKSWGALPYFGRWPEEQPMREQHRHFIVDEAKMARTNNARFSHCLPLRRNVKATDAVMDADYCMAVDEAENRLHVQKALMMRLNEHASFKLNDE